MRQKVCQMDWYKAGGQLVAIDSASGAWAAMSAVTRFAGSDHAYHLHTGVDPRSQSSLMRHRFRGGGVWGAALHQLESES